MAPPTPGPRLYRSRRPERTLLYRALTDSFERFLSVYEDRFERAHGFFRRSVTPAVYRYLDCGIFAHGAAWAHCAECGHDVLIAFSCKLLCLCPSCLQKRELLWVEWAGELLAEVPHRQVVFTVPKRLRIFFRFDRKLLGELPGCVEAVPRSRIFCRVANWRDQPRRRSDCCSSPMRRSWTSRGRGRCSPPLHGQGTSG